MMISDPATFLQQVIQQALSHFNPDGTEHVDLENPDSKMALVEILGDRLAAMLQLDCKYSAGRGADPDSGLPPGERAHYQALLEHNATLAFALGACDCWGELSDCNVCWGAGKPGWTLPDPHFFAQLIRPALRTIRETSVSRGRVARSKRWRPNNER